MTMSVTGDPSAAGELGKQRLAQFGATAATVLGKEGHQRDQRRYVGALYLLAPALFGSHEADPRHHGEMGGKGALAQAACLDQRAGRQTFGLVPDQQPKGIKPRGMCK